MHVSESKWLTMDDKGSIILEPMDSNESIAQMVNNDE